MYSINEISSFRNRIKDNKCPNLINIINRFRKQILINQSIFSNPLSAFNTFKSKKNEKSQPAKKPAQAITILPRKPLMCPYNKEHFFPVYAYFNPDNRPTNQKPDPKIKKKVKERKKNVSFRITLKYILIKQKAKKGIKTDSEEQKTDFNVYATYFTAATILKDENFLYRYQIFDSGANIYIINYSEDFTITRKIMLIETLFKNKNVYLIKVYGSVQVMLQILKRIKKITLRNVTLVIGYLTNIVVMRRLSKGGVYQSSERPDMFTKNSLIYTNLFIYLFMFYVHMRPCGYDRRPITSLAVVRTLTTNTTTER